MNRYSNIILTAAFIVVSTAIVFAQQAQSANPAPPAQTANVLSTELKQLYTIVKNNLTKLAEKMPEEHYGFKAAPEIGAFGQLIAHVAEAQTRNCTMVNGNRKEINLSAKTAKAELVAALKESFAVCDVAFDALTDAKASDTIPMGQRQRSKFGLLSGLVSHSNEEYGYLAVYLRLKGIVPPSSEGR